MLEIEKLYAQIFNIKHIISEKQDEFAKKHRLLGLFFPKQYEIEMLNIANRVYQEQIPNLEIQFIGEWERLINCSIESFKQELNEIKKGVIPEIEATNTQMPSMDTMMEMVCKTIEFKPCKIAMIVPCTWAKKEK